MLMHCGPLAVIKPRTAQLAVLEFKSERMNQVQGTAGIGAKAYDIARIGRYLRLIQHNMEHRGTFKSGIYLTAMTETERQKLALDFCGLSLTSPLVLLSGCVGFGEEYTRVAGFSNRDVGAVCLKGTTLEPRLGNRPHRVAETPAGMLNAIGLQNPGTAHVINHILPSLDFSETRFFANVSGSTVEEYAEVTRRFDDSPIDAIEINISCPNVKEGGVTFGNDPDMSARVVAACRAVTRKPLITICMPAETRLRWVAARIGRLKFPE